MIDSSMLLLVSEQLLTCASQLLIYALRSIDLLALIQVSSSPECKTYEWHPRLNKAPPAPSPNEVAMPSAAIKNALAGRLQLPPIYYGEQKLLLRQHLGHLLFLPTLLDAIGLLLVRSVFNLLFAFGCCLFVTSHSDRLRLLYLDELW